MMSTLLLAFAYTIVVVVFGLIGSFFATGFLVTFASGRKVTPGWARAGRSITLTALTISDFVALLLPAFNRRAIAAGMPVSHAIQVVTRPTEADPAQLRTDIQKGLVKLMAWLMARYDVVSIFALPRRRASKRSATTNQARAATA